MLDCEQSLFFFLSLSALEFAMSFCGSTNSRKSPEEENWIETVRSLNYVGVLGNNRMMKLFAWLRNNFSTHVYGPAPRLQQVPIL